MPEKYWSSRRMPCKMADNLYYVGNDQGPAHMVKTGDGLVLIDTGYPQTLYLLIENIRALGEDPYNIKHIIHSHGHYDHIGGTRALVEMTGAKTYIGRLDADMVRGVSGDEWANHLGYPFEEPFEPDVIIDDGDEITIGETTFRFVSTPGHTAGTVSIFFKVPYKGKMYLAGMFGGAGLNTLTTSAMARYNIPAHMRGKFIESIDKIIEEPVELHLGNHLSDNDHRSKQARITDEFNPFIEENTYVSFLTKKRKDALEMFEKDKL